MTWQVVRAPLCPSNMLQYPGWIEKNAGKYPPEEVAVYRAQSAKVREIVDLFDDPNYSDDNTAKSRLVREKMMEVGGCCCLSS